MDSKEPNVANEISKKEVIDTNESPLKPTPVQTPRVDKRDQPRQKKKKKTILKMPQPIAANDQ